MYIANILQTARRFTTTCTVYNHEIILCNWDDRTNLVWIIEVKWWQIPLSACIAKKNESYFNTFET